MKDRLYPKIINEIESLDTNSISKERIEILEQLVAYAKSKIDTIRLNFICTHNSRRSHLSQIWAQTMAHYFNLENVECYSGGTESTAIFPMVIQTLKKLGFEIEKIQDTTNPIYAIRSSKDQLPLIGFSKKYDDFFNPSSDFAAIMTCSEADKGCPIIMGCDVRIPISYKDPKAFDDSEIQEDKYLECSRTIASEMKYIFQKVKA